MIKQYETVFIATPVLSEAQMKEAVAKYTGFIKDNGGEIVYEEDWGLKQLAYPIQKKTSGFYYLIDFFLGNHIRLIFPDAASFHHCFYYFVCHSGISSPLTVFLSLIISLEDKYFNPCRNGKLNYLNIAHFNYVL